MTSSDYVLSSLQKEIESLTQQREDVLNQLSLIDLQIKNYNNLVINIDRKAIESINFINNAIIEIKQAYENLILTGCFSDLAWVETTRWSETIQGGAGDGSQIYDVEYIKYEVQKNPDLRKTIPSHGIKYYRQPSNRDYGTFIINNFNGGIGIGSSLLTIFGETLPTGIEIGNSITDSIDTPVIFNPTDLPTIVGIGTTSYVGIFTSFGGRISSGSTIFLQSGSGSNSGVSTGMILINSSVLEEDTRIVGFGTSSFAVQYFTQSGVSTVGIATCKTFILNKPSVADSSGEIEFKVGILTTLNAISLSTVTINSTDYKNFIIFKKGDLTDIDRNFDPIGNPNAPLEIGIIEESKLGMGHSIFYDASGNSSETVIYNQNQTYFDLFTNQTINPEPLVGSGTIEYYEGNELWPIKITPTLGILNDIVGYDTSAYASLGEVVVVQAGTGIGIGTTIGYATTGPSGSVCTPSVLNSLYDAITVAENNLFNVINQWKPLAENLVVSGRVLRKQRASKELYAWSLLQGSSYLRNQLDALKEDLQILINSNLANFN